MSELKKILIAPDGFKESLRAIDVAKSMEIGVKKVWPNIETTLLPVADGGDGTMETIIGQSNGKIYKSNVTDPLGRKIVAEWGGYPIRLINEGNLNRPNVGDTIHPRLRMDRVMWWPHC